MKVGIVGTSGYSGGELLRILAGHSEATVEYVASTSRAGQRLDSHFPAFKGMYDLQFEPVDTEAMARRCDVVFTATPHGVAMDLAAGFVDRGVLLIDIGADFRFRDAAVFSTWYKTAHTQPDLARETVYGLPELFRADIQKARIIGNPGCYPTSAILALAPLLDAGLIDPTTIHVFSMSGVSGAGASPAAAYHFPHRTENAQAYGIPGHRHTAEIEQGIRVLTGEESPAITFAPHLVPMSRGILTHVTAAAVRPLTQTALDDVLHQFYNEEPFVRVCDDRLPDTKSVQGSNFCDVAAIVDERTGRITAVSAIDNLVKGASGQAVQNMNIRLGLPETAGLWRAGLTP